MRPFAHKVSKELRAALKLQAIANKEAKIEPKRGRAALRAEANIVRRELKHDAGMNAKRRSRAEHVYQIKLTMQRAKIALNKRIGDILTGLADKERKTDLGIVLPSGKQIGDILSNVKAPVSAGKS
jgi:hypothetical protein